MFCSCALIFFCFYLFVACLHAEEDDVRRRTGQTSLQVRLTSDFFGLHIVGVQRLDRLLEQSPLDLLAEKQTHKHPGRDVGADTQRKGLKVCVFRCIACTSSVFCAHPVVQLWRELGQEATHCSFAVVSLDEDLGHQRSAVPQLLEVMELNAEQEEGKLNHDPS